MRRELAGLRAARIRPISVVQVAVAAAGVLFLAACAPVDASDAGLTAPAPTTTAPTTTAPTTAAPTTAPTTSAAQTAGSVAPLPLPKPKPKPAPKPAPKPKPAPAPAPKPSPAPKPAPAPSTCDPNYAGQCLKDGIGDYDCSGGSGNGPNYVYGTVRVVGSDPFALDRDKDGLGCEDG